MGSRSSSSGRATSSDTRSCRTSSTRTSRTRDGCEPASDASGSLARSRSVARVTSGSPGPSPTAVEVFGADEQSDVEVDVVRWVRLAQLVLTEERVPGVAELSLIFVDEQSITDLNERFLGGTGPTDVLAFPMDDDVVLGGRQPDQGGRGPGAPAEAGEPPSLIGDVVVCPRVAAAQAPEHG